MRYKVLVVLGLLVLLLVGGWAQAATPPVLEELSAAVHRLEARATALEERIDRLEARINQLALDPSRIGLSRVNFLPDPPPGKVTVQFLAEVEKRALPGKFTFHLAPEGARLFDTRSVPKGGEIEIGPELEDGIAFVEPGKFYRLQVIYKNPENREVKFLVRGVLIDPQGALPFVRNRCWCAAVPFTAPPEGVFSRIIDMGVGLDTPPRAKVIAVFPVVPLEE